MDIDIDTLDIDIIFGLESAWLKSFFKKIILDGYSVYKLILLLDSRLDQYCPLIKENNTYDPSMEHSIKNRQN